MTGNEITPAVEEFLAGEPNLIFATIRKDGRPQLSPVWFVWRDGAFFISTTKATAKPNASTPTMADKRLVFIITMFPCLI